MLELLTSFYQSTPVQASDGTFWRTAGQALAHDLLEVKWRRLLPTLMDPAVIAQTRKDLGLS